MSQQKYDKKAKKLIKKVLTNLAVQLKRRH